MFFQPDGSDWLPPAGGVRLRNASQASSADIAMNPRDAAKAKGCIDSVISFTKTKLLPHVPEVTIRLTHSVETGSFSMRLRQIDFDCFDGKSHSGRLRWDTQFGVRDRSAKDGVAPPGF